MLIYVDDLILTSKKVGAIKLEAIKFKRYTQRLMTDLGLIHDILGINVEREELIGGIRLLQKKYIEQLIQNSI